MLSGRGVRKKGWLIAPFLTNSCVDNWKLFSTPFISFLCICYLDLSVFQVKNIPELTLKLSHSRTPLNKPTYCFPN